MKFYHLVIILMGFISCMSMKSKNAYVEKKMAEMAIKYNVKVEYIDPPSHASYRKMKESLNLFERGMATMPDSLRFMGSDVPSFNNGTFNLRAKFDSNQYIINKNKIKYIKTHHIQLPPHLIIIEPN